MNVLLIDDDLPILSMIQGALEKWGHKVDAYLNPEICPAYSSPACHCDRFNKGCPDVILTDVNMPLVNGIKFVEELKRKSCKCRKIGMMSGDWNDSDLLKAYSMGVKIFAKPFDLSKLQLWLSESVPVVYTDVVNIRNISDKPGVTIMGDGSINNPITWIAKLNIAYQVMKRSNIMKAWSNASDGLGVNQLSLQTAREDGLLQYADPDYAGMTDAFYRVNVVQ